MAAPLKRRYWILALLFLFMLINFQDKGLLGLAAKPMMADLGIDEARYGTIASSFYLLFSVASILVGFIINKTSAKWLLIALALVWSAAQMPVMIPVVGVGGMIATRVLLGAGEGPVVASVNNTMFGWFRPAERAVPANVLSMGSSLGVIVGAPLMVSVIGALGWRAAFGVLGGVGLIWVVVWMMIGRDGPFSARTAAKAPAAESAETAQAVEPAEVAEPAEPKVPFWRILLSPTWLAATIGGLATYWGLAVALSFLALFLEEEAHFSATAVGFLVGLPSATAIAMFLVAGFISQRLLKAGRSRWLAQSVVSAVFLVASFVAMFVQTRVGGGTPLVIAMAIAFSAGNVLTPLAAVAIGDICPPSQRGAALGCWYGVINVASIIAPQVTGILVAGAATPGEGFQVAFDTAGAIALVGAAVVIILMRADRDAKRLRPAAPRDDDAVPAAV